MSWVRIDDGVPHHQKFLKAGAAASWLWVCGLAYSQRQLTDGIIPREAVPTLGVPNPRKLIDKLVAVGLWDVHELGWRVHDYLDYNDCREEALAKRAATSAARSGAGRRGMANRWQPDNKPITNRLQTDNKPDNKTITVRNNKPITPSHPIPSNTPPNGGVARARGSPIHDSSHVKHAFCGRVCMPRPLFDEFVRRRNTLNADSEILDWAVVIDGQWADGGKFADVEPGDPYSFWKARYAEQWPVRTAARPAVTSAVPDAETTRRKYLNDEPAA